MLSSGLPPGTKILPRADVTYLDKLLLDDKGYMRAVGAADLNMVPHHHRQIWAVKHGIYQFVTHELIDFLRNEIGADKAIEINAGDGCISRSLGITGIDDRSNTNNPQAKLLFALTGGTPTSCPPEILEMDSMEAVRKFEPDIVVGAYVTQKCTLEELEVKAIPGNLNGIDEVSLIPKVKKYIHIGNKETHKGKFAYRLPHQELSFPWLFNRSHDQTLNRIWIWKK